MSGIEQSMMKRELYEREPEILDYVVVCVLAGRLLSAFTFFKSRSSQFR